MKPSKLRRAMRHAGKSEQDYRIELARRAFNAGFGTTRETASVLALADCNGEDIGILRTIWEGQCGSIARNGIEGPVSSGFTSSPDSAKVRRSMEHKARVSHVREVVSDSVRLESWIEWGLIALPEGPSKVRTVNAYVPRPADHGRKPMVDRKGIMSRLRALGPAIRRDIRSGILPVTSVTVSSALAMISGPSHRL